MLKENAPPTANSLSDQEKHRCFQTKTEHLLLVDAYKKNLKGILQTAEKKYPRYRHGDARKKAWKVPDGVVNREIEMNIDW